MARVAAAVAEVIWAEALPEAAVSTAEVLAVFMVMAAITDMAATMSTARMGAVDGAEAVPYISAGPGTVGRGPTITRTITRPRIPFILPHPRQTAAGIGATILKAIILMF